VAQLEGVVDALLAEVDRLQLQLNSLANNSIAVNATRHIVVPFQTVSVEVKYDQAFLRSSRRGDRFATFSAKEHQRRSSSCASLAMPTPEATTQVPNSTPASATSTIATTTPTADHW
jgi:hypothetical protein